MKIANKFGLFGIAAGYICLATLFVIEIYGTGSHSASGAGKLYADGTFTIDSNRTFFHQIAQIALVAFLAPLILGAISVFKKENIFIALGAFCFGLAPLLIYMLGIFMTAMIFLAVTLPATGLHVFRKIKET